MSDLIVVGFKNNMFKASDVLNQLRQMNEDWTVNLEDAVAVHRGQNGKLRIDQSYDPTTGEGAAWGGLWGSLLGAILAIPFTGGMSAAAAAGALAAGAVSVGAIGATAGAIDADWWKEDFGISDEFVRDVGETIQLGDSAIFALISANSEQAVNRFSGYGGKIIRTTLSNKQAAKIEKVLNRGRDYSPKSATL
ncbi:MAG TPA: DUF1269 domain-containing protein [Methylococcaceae bacterium]|jgi:uncharacterized membrane protein|nr:DUF1269 domain-containing protein [Methylococcaceae bacterium]